MMNICRFYDELLIRCVKHICYCFVFVIVCGLCEWDEQGNVDRATNCFLIKLFLYDWSFCCYEATHEVVRRFVWVEMVLFSFGIGECLLGFG